MRQRDRRHTYGRHRSHRGGYRELGAACVKHLARLKVDERVVHILSAFDLGGELDKIALRGGRYGIPGCVGQQERKSGEPKPVYLDPGEAERRAREFLRSAKSAAEIAGRQVVLLAMARYAGEEAIAQSQRSFYSLSPGRQLPFSGEVIDTLDELCAERLPAHVLERAPRPAKGRPASCWIKGDRLRPHVPRETPRWSKLYRGRAAVEREFGRPKNEWAVLPLRVRGLERVQLHADLTIFVKLTCALARARAVPLCA